MDQGILAILNTNVPGCEANNDFATWAQTSRNVQSAVKGQPCPTGYETAAHDNDAFPDSSYYMCRASTGYTPPSQELKNRINACLASRSPAPSAPAPSAAPGFPIWAIILIVVCVGLVLLFLSTY